VFICNEINKLPADSMPPHCQISIQSSKHQGKSNGGTNQLDTPRIVHSNVRESAGIQTNNLEWKKIFLCNLHWFCHWQEIGTEGFWVEVNQQY
jgi:hypothetical protein